MDPAAPVVLVRVGAAKVAIGTGCAGIPAPVCDFDSRFGGCAFTDPCNPKPADVLLLFVEMLP